jgi:hypothetical protein
METYSQAVRPLWLDEDFWVLLLAQEHQHERLQVEHEAARRRLDRLRREDVDELQRAWAAYRLLIDELDRTSAALERLRGVPPASPVADDTLANPCAPASAGSTARGAAG